LALSEHSSRTAFVGYWINNGQRQPGSLAPRLTATCANGVCTLDA